MRLMYDSTTASDIPADAEIVAGYVDGRYAWSDADWARFPNAVKVRISVFGSLDADVLDVEPSDATPADAAVWVAQKNARREHATVYCGGYNRTQVDAVCAGLEYDVWLADPTGVAHNNDAATQYSWHGFTGEHFDLSLCADWWPRVAAAEPDGPSVADLLQALSYLKAEVARVATQYGAA